jgi:quinoprotein glucose dehydrogenase
MAFLKQPSLAPVGSAATGRIGLGRAPSEPAYPDDVEGPPSRYKTGYGNEGFIIKPPWSTITAYDLNTGKIKWQTPYGDVPQAPPSDTLRGNVYPKSGFVITAGGLILFAGNDAKLYALDSSNGKMIFSKDIPNGSQGVPAVYEVNGREFVLVGVSGPGTPYPDGAYVPPGGKVIPPATWKGYMAFALPAAGK